MLTDDIKNEILKFNEWFKKQNEENNEALTSHSKNKLIIILNPSFYPISNQRYILDNSDLFENINLDNL